MIDIRLSDNLELMAEIEDNTVDLIYCDILYGTGRKFKDYQDLKPKREIIEEHYIPRIKEMHRVLKDNGSIYLQMDTRINHWMRCIMDDVFEYDNFRNEISWWYKRWSNISFGYQKMHDVILFYSKDKSKFNIQYQEYSNENEIEDTIRGVIDGKLVLDERVSKNTKFDVGVGEDMEFAMSRMIRDLNAYLQGQYSDQKRSEIQRYWYGKLIMLLRKWLPRGLKYRWAGIGKVGIGKDQLGPDDIFYSRALGTITEGYYTTSLRFLHGIYLDLKALKAQVIMEESRRNIRALTKERWEGLTDNEQGNVQKTIREAATIVILTLAATALKEAGDEDDKREKFYYLASFYAIRLQKEMLTYINPSEFTNTLRSPSASLIMIDRITHAISQLVSNPTEVYATGRRKGTLKVAKDFEDLVPILKHIDRDVDEALGFLLAKKVR